MPVLCIFSKSSVDCGHAYATAYHDAACTLVTYVTCRCTSKTDFYDRRHVLLTGNNNDKTHLIMVLFDVFIVQMKQSACVDTRNHCTIMVQVSNSTGAPEEAGIAA